MAATAPQAKPSSVDANVPMLRRYRAVRRRTELLCEPLKTEDYVVQSMPDASPTRWHIAHTTWFFETFLLPRMAPGYEPLHPDFSRLFNSYYNAVGEQFPRAQRGVLTRPTVTEVFAYRRHVDEIIEAALVEQGASLDRVSGDILEIGLNHEQQHQELILTDIKHAFSCNPLCPAYRPPLRASTAKQTPPAGWVRFEKSLRCIGNSGSGFSFDNERPQHIVHIDAFELADRLVTNAEYADFIADRAYERAELWLADGWSCVQAECWQQPLYWRRHGGAWMEFTLGGLRELEPAAPVCHVSYFEADAFARWRGMRLPTEAEWEVAAGHVEIAGNFLESERLHPRPVAVDELPACSAPLRQLFGDAWEWTASAYLAYPGYQPAAGALGEYNGKFMCNQFVLRGGSCVTPQTHIRATYRNFFPPAVRWQFTGIRLAR